MIKQHSLEGTFWKSFGPKSLVKAGPASNIESYTDATQFAYSVPPSDRTLASRESFDYPEAHIFL